MLKEMTVTGKTVDEALAKAAKECGRKVEELQYEIIEQPKKGFLGIGNVDAKLAVKYEESPTDRAKDFLAAFISNLGFSDVEITSEILEDGDIFFNLKGENLGLVIGRHGEILDSLQYLTNLAANRQEKDFVRVLVDIENYRDRRAETLKALSHKVAARVIKNQRSVSLEPMNAYERRIIHSEVQDIEGVVTFSIGTGDERRIVVAPENYKGRNSSEKRSGGKKNPSGKSMRASSEKASAEDFEAKKAPEVKEEKAPAAKLSESAPSKKEKKYDPDSYRKNATEVAGAAPVVYEYNPVRQPKEIKKAKSIEELGLADVEDTEEVQLKK